MSLKKNVHWLIYGLFLLGCARQTSPTGGPKDSIPPILIYSNPKDGQTKFSSQQIDLAFNETVILNNPKDQIIITPDIRKEYDIDVKKNRVVLKLKTDLQDSTTYAINFREAVQDITEKNSPPTLKLAFSTGTYIDSLSFSGTIFDPQTSKESKDITVAIYQQDTFNIFEHKPEYFSKTNDKGRYVIGNLKPGNYRLYAFDDRNKNLIVDSKSESYGFLSSVKQLTDKLDSIRIPILRLDTRPLKLTSARPSGTVFTIKTSKNLKSYHLKSTELPAIYSSFGEDNANINIYKNLVDQDSVLIHFTAHDSVNNKIDTTLYLKFSNRVVKPQPLKTTTSNFQIIAHKGILKGQLHFSKPVATINYDSILYRIDSLTSISIQPSDITIDSIHNILSINKTFDKNLLLPKPTATTSPSDDPKSFKQKQLKARPPKIKNQLYIAPASFISIESDSSTRIAQPIEPSTLETSGVIHVQIQTKEPNYLVQLLTKDNAILQQKSNLATISFEDLPPGEYKLRLIIDRDNDQEWSPGNYLLNKEPETIVFYRNEKGTLPVSLKANWELGPLLITF